VLGRARLLGSADQGRLWSGARADWFAQGAAAAAAAAAAGSIA